MWTRKRPQVLHAFWQSAHRKLHRSRHWVELFQPTVHPVQRHPNREHTHDHANHDRQLRLPWCCADQITGLQILRAVARVAGCDAHHATDRDRQRAKRRRRPPLNQEDRRRGHQGGNGHAAHRACAGTDNAYDARRHGHKQEPKHHD